MLRRVLASVLIAFWIFFSGMDLLEDLDLGIFSKIQNSRRSTLAILGQAGKVVNDNFESSHRTLVATIRPVRPTAEQSLNFESIATETQVPKKSLRIYKLHSAFLI